jgi:ribosomal protein L16 Arg81 hydroxylase
VLIAETGQRFELAACDALYLPPALAHQGVARSTCQKTLHTPCDRTVGAFAVFGRRLKSRLMAFSRPSACADEERNQDRPKIGHQRRRHPVGAGG